MPVRWSVWKQAAFFVVVWSTLWFVTGPNADVPWPSRLVMSACLGVLFGAFAVVGLAVSQRRAFGDRLTGAQRAQVEAIVLGRARSDDPRLRRAAFCLAREWTSWHNSVVIAAVATGVFLVGTVGAAVDLQPQFWLWVALVIVAGPWGIWLVARNRAAAARFLATASPPADSVAWFPWAN